MRGAPLNSKQTAMYHAYDRNNRGGVRYYIYSHEMLLSIRNSTWCSTAAAVTLKKKYGPRHTKKTSVMLNGPMSLPCRSWLIVHAGKTTICFLRRTPRRNYAANILTTTQKTLKKSYSIRRWLRGNQETKKLRGARICIQQQINIFVTLIHQQRG